MPLAPRRTSGRPLLLVLLTLAPWTLGTSACSGDHKHAPVLTDPDFGSGGDEATADSGEPTAAGGRNAGGRASGGRPSGGRSAGGSSSGGTGGAGGNGSGGTGGAGGGGGRGSGGRGSGGSSASGGTTSGSGGLGSGGTDACTPGKTWTGDANLHSMADLESLRGYTAVTGFLYIGSSAEVPAPDISTLDALSCLATVGNDLELLEDPYLTDLRGLENLKSVGHDFKMSSMASLGTLDALRGVTVARVFLAKDDPALVSLGRGVTSASSLEISSDASLPHCELLAFEASVSGVVTCTCDATAPGTCTSPGADAGVDAGVDAAAP